jgi:hypothetical protein
LKRSLALAALAAAALLFGPLSRAHAASESGESGRLEIHGYGEIHYNNPEIGTMDRRALAMVDVHRLVLGWEYEFTPSLRLEAEVDYEHAAGEIELEEAFLEYDLGATTSIRVGSLLMPMGSLNEFHEPPTYHSVERPYVETYVIPTTWQEIGVGIAGRGRNGALGYRLYVVSGLDAAGFDAMKGIREGRQHGAEATAEDLAVVGRLEYAARGGVSFGASGYYGGADQGDITIGKVTVGIAEADLRVRRGAIDLRAVAAGIDVPDYGSGQSGGTGRRIYGLLGEAAFDLLHGRSNAEGDRRLWIFGRVERFDTTADGNFVVPRVPEAERTVLTGGLAYHPIQPVAFKADFEHWKDGADQELNRFNLGAAFQF